MVRATEYYINIGSSLNVYKLHLIQATVAEEDMQGKGMAGDFDRRPDGGCQ